MRTLTDLMRTPDGIDFLAERGIFADQARFAAALEAPAEAGLANLIGVEPKQPLVYVGQQVCADYAQPTLTKFELESDLSQHGIGTVVLWHDMYQADSDRFGTRVLPPEGVKARGFWLVPRALASNEPRFLQMEPGRLAEAFAGLRSWIGRTSMPDRDAARSRLALLEDSVLASAPATLAEAAASMAEFLLKARFGHRRLTTFASRMARQGLFNAMLNEVLGCLDAFRIVFNEAVEELLAADINPQVRTLPQDYLPLHYSDPETGERLRLRHDRSGPDHWATAMNRSGRTLRLHIGSGRASLGELAEDQRWSLDVSMPIFHNDLASGWIAGRSTALYGLVYNRVLRKVLGRQPIPAVVPRQLGDATDEDGLTLLFAYLMGPAAEAPRG